MKAFLLAAGFGTRLKPFTDKHPKALAKVNGKSLLERNILRLQQTGIYDIVVNVHHFARQIIDCLEENKGFGSQFEISDETDMILETGGGLLRAKPFLENENDFVVMNVDILSNIDLKKMIQHHTLMQPLATLAVMQRESSRYFLLDNAMQLCGWKNITTNEEKIPLIGIKNRNSLHSYAFSGIQVVRKDIYEHIRFTGKFSLVDLYLDICATQPVKGWDHTGDILMDAGKPETLEKAAQFFK